MQNPSRLRNQYPYFGKRGEPTAEVNFSIRTPEYPQIRTSRVWEKQHAIIS